LPFGQYFAKISSEGRSSQISHKLKINKEIRAQNVRLIDEDGTQHGVVSLSEALLKASDAGLDLVEVSPNGETPVVKIIDYGKYRYEQEKKLQKAKKAQKNQEVKGIRLSVKIGRHDFETKLARAKEFIEKGSKLSIQLRFKGREMAHPELGKKVMMDFVTELGPDMVIDAEPKLQGRSMNITVSQKVKK
jgi:translation initiation factor IF-3